MVQQHYDSSGPCLQDMLLDERNANEPCLEHEARSGPQGINITFELGGQFLQNFSIEFIGKLLNWKYFQQLDPIVKLFLPVMALLYKTWNMN